MDDDPPKFYSYRCSMLDEVVTVGWYDTHCKCGTKIVGVPRKEEQKKG